MFTWLNRLSNKVIRQRPSPTNYNDTYIESTSKAIAYHNRKKHSRKSISWHKRRILARLNPKTGENVEIIQHYIGNSQSTISIYITYKPGEYTTTAYYPLCGHNIQEHHRVIRALKYLVNEGKIKSNITNKEWEVQIALGVAEKREFVHNV